jgi:peptidyl-prolyl cis-trans isomerase B (cyclophilin B)
MESKFHHLPALGFLALALALFPCGCGDNQGGGSQEAGGGEGSAAKSPEAGAGGGEGKIAVLHTTQGKIKIEFFPDKAPEHVKNFKTHAQRGYYDGTYFHRCFVGFMIQGGDPNTKDDDPRNDGNGGHSHLGPGKFLRAEFNDVHHARGIVSMARSMSLHSAGSQFFIMVADKPGLDGQYTAFGRVVEGMDVVDKIVKQPGKPIPGAGGVNPFKHQYIEKITFE